MAGGATGGQRLTPNPNVNAPAGSGGSLWGANGGGITPIGGGVAGQQGWDTKEANALATCQTQANYVVNGQPQNTRGAPTQTVASQLAKTALSAQVADTALPAGGSNAG